jgi:flagellar motor protein MotB
MYKIRNLLILFCLLRSLFLCAQEHIVYFESTQDTISQLETITLDSIINLLDPYKAYIVEVTGHTDSIGGVKYNQALSKRRANQIQQYINKSDISVDISVMWKAYFSPAQSNASEEGLARNRRVEINFTEIIPKKNIWDMPVQEFALNASKAYVLHTKNGCKITIKPSSFKVNAGDTVYVLITEYNDPTDFLAGGLPMSFNKGGEEFMYQSEQMMKIEAIVDDKPVPLLQMIGLECPDVDVLEGLRLYKFHGKKESFVDIKQKKMVGFAQEFDYEEIKIDNLIKQSFDRAKDSIKQKAPTNKTSESKDGTKSRKKNGTNKSSSGSGGNKSSKSKKKRKERKKERNANWPNKNTNGGKFELEPDTGRTYTRHPDRGFLLEPDTGFSLEPDTGRGSNHTNDCITSHRLGNINLCNLDSLKKIVDFAHLLKGESIPIPLNSDFNPYFARYKSPAYHGMTLKCSRDSSELNYVRISTKKRFLQRKLMLKFESTPDHPEYLPFKNTKWIVRYGKAINDAQKIKNIRINDFRILRFKKADYSKKSKEGYYIELKGDNEMFRFAAKPRKKKKSATAFKKYRKLYRDRIQSFDDSIRQIFNAPKVIRHFNLYLLLKRLSWPLRTDYCSYSTYHLPPCLDFHISELKQNSPNLPVHSSNQVTANPDDCFPSRKPDCEEQHFMDWVKFYNANSNYMRKKIDELKNNLPRYYKCLCGIDIDPVGIDTVFRINPCDKLKWEYADINSVGDKITYIGLGTYNFDYIFRVEAKQRITNPIFITTEGDTVRTCWSTSFPRVRQRRCEHQLYSIIPNFNGLLEHNYSPRFSLLKNKENMLFLKTTYKKYKCYVDMREKDQYIGKIFIVKDITEASKTLEGLREELTKVD